MIEPHPATDQMDGGVGFGLDKGIEGNGFGLRNPRDAKNKTAKMNERMVVALIPLKNHFDRAMQVQS